MLLLAQRAKLARNRASTIQLIWSQKDKRNRSSKWLVQTVSNEYENMKNRYLELCTISWLCGEVYLLNPPFGAHSFSSRRSPQRCADVCTEMVEFKSIIVGSINDPCVARREGDRPHRIKVAFRLMFIDALQILTVPSSDPETTRMPSKEKMTDLTSCKWSSSFCSSLPVNAFQIRAGTNKLHTIK